MHLYCAPYAPHTASLSFFLIWSPESQLVSSKEHKASCYVAFPLPCYIVLLWPKYFPQHPILEHLWPMFSIMYQAFVFCVRKVGYLVGRNLQEIIVCINEFECTCMHFYASILCVCIYIYIYIYIFDNAWIISVCSSVKTNAIRPYVLWSRVNLYVWRAV